MDESSSESSEESVFSDEGSSEFGEVLKYFTRNDSAVEFSLFCLGEITRKRERIHKNTFGSKSFTAVKPQTTDLGFQKQKSPCKETKGPTSAASSTTVDTAGQTSECIISDNNRERHQILKCVIRDELKLFEDSEIEYMIE